MRCAAGAGAAAGRTAPLETLAQLRRQSLFVAPFQPSNDPLPSAQDSPPPREPDSDLGHADVPPAHRAPHGHALPDPSQRGEEGHPWPDPNQGHSHGLHLPAPLERMKESAVHAAEGVKLRLHLSGGGGGGGTAEERTGRGPQGRQGGAQGC